MSRISSCLAQLFIALTVFSTLIASTPMLMIRRVQPPYLQSIERLERMIDEEREVREAENEAMLYDDSIIRSRNRKSIPDGYFTEFTLNDFVDRHRRGQPISEIDEFSADPFEITVSTPITEETKTTEKVGRR